MDAKVKTLSACPDSSGGVWDESHEKEAGYQRESRLKRKLQALKDGLLLPHEADDELEQFILKLQGKQQLNPAELTQNEKRKNALYKGVEKPKFLNGPVKVSAFICPGANPGVSLTDIIAPVRDHCFAQVIVTKSLKTLPETVHLSAALRGAYVMDSASLTGKPGLCFKFKGTGHLKRSVWASVDFKKVGFCGWFLDFSCVRSSNHHTKSWIISQDLARS